MLAEISRELLGVAATQVAGKDHHALGVDRLAEVDFALDIDDAAAARIDGRGNPRRHAEHRVAHLQHGQSVALADRGASGVDQDDPRQHVVEDPRRHPSGAGLLALRARSMWPSWITSSFAS